MNGFSLNSYIQLLQSCKKFVAVQPPVGVYRIQAWYTGVHGDGIHFYKDIVLNS
jgi:hypothetical protein